MKFLNALFAVVALVCLSNTVNAQNVYPASGNVGIGTSTPQQRLHVHSNSFSVIEISGTAAGILFSPNSTSSLYTAAIGLTTSSTYDHYLTGSNYGDLNFRTGINKRLLFGTLGSGQGNGVIRMAINPNGQVNIGPGSQTDPYSKLHVEGAISATGAIRTLSIKLGDNSSKLKMRRYNSGDQVFKIALEATAPAIGELWLNSTGGFSNGTRIKGSKLVVDGVLGIGVSDTRGYKLAVKGNILAEELKIRTYANWPDYVFEDDYELASLSDLESAIEVHGHLPGLPSAKEVGESGFNVSEMNAKLLEKVEELTLYLIELNKKVETLEVENAELQQQVGNK
ncbi:MAG TPA: hypothetical protein ENJ82_12935 [Bacteroidetes bacterium]|nr:hypothetical protein [Bacteroidota bacterium]